MTIAARPYQILTPSTNIGKARETPLQLSRQTASSGGDERPIRPSTRTTRRAVPTDTDSQAKSSSAAGRRRLDGRADVPLLDDERQRQPRGRAVALGKRGMRCCSAQSARTRDHQNLALQSQIFMETVGPTGAKTSPQTASQSRLRHPSQRCCERPAYVDRAKQRRRCSTISCNARCRRRPPGARVVRCRIVQASGTSTATSCFG